VFVVQRIDLIAQAMRRMPIVIVPVRDDLAARGFTRPIALRPNRDFLVQADIANAIIARNEIADRVSAVVDDDQFLGLVILPQEVFNRTRDELAAIVRRHDAGDEG
jgi:hypothetical protein